MKIALIIHKLNIKGGVQRHVLAVGRELKRKGHGVKIYTFVFDKSAVFDADTEGAEIVSLQGYKPLRSSSEIMREKKAAYLAIDTLNVKRFIKNMDGILVLDKRDKNWVKEFFGKDAEIIGNGLDILRFPFTGRALTAGRPINILMQGIFAVHRRFEDGINTLHQNI